MSWWVGVVSVLQASPCNTDTTPTQPHRNSNTHRTKNNTTSVVIQQNSRTLLMMDILMSETCWARKKWNKIASDIKLVFYSSTVTMMHCPIRIRYKNCLVYPPCGISNAHIFIGRWIHLPMKMEPIVSSETSAIKSQTPGNYAKRNKLQLEHGESLKTSI